MIASTYDIQPFKVVKGEFVLWFEPAPEGGFAVTCENLPILNAQGDTFEEAFNDAMQCIAFLREPDGAENS